MSWVQLGRVKLHTLQIAYVEQVEEGANVYFLGNLSQPLSVGAEEARALWRYLKADNPMAGPDKGSTMVLPRLASAVAVDVDSDKSSQSRAQKLAAGVAKPVQAQAAPAQSSQQKLRPQGNVPKISPPASRSS